MNQCDGCRRGLPLENGNHINPDSQYDMIGCTSELYLEDRMSESKHTPGELHNQVRNTIAKTKIEEEVVE